MPKNTSERIIDRPLQGRQTARVWSGSSSTSSTDTSTTADALLAIDFITLNANATLTNERYLDVTNGLTKTDEGAGARLLLALEVPGTLSVSSTNTSTGNHTHGITSSSAPGAAASLLASSGSGNLTLPTFTASTKLTSPLIDTASGGLTISPANSVTSVTGALVASTKLTSPLIDTASGNLTIAPASNLLLSPATNAVSLTSSVNIGSNNYASQTTGWRVDYNGAGDFRYLYTDELHAKTFIADLEQALAGGQIIAKSVTLLYSNFTAPAAGASTTLTVRDLPSATGMAVFQNGDIIRLRQFSRSAGSLTIGDCWGTVTLDTTYGVSGFDSSSKSQRYTFTRSTAPNAGAMTATTVVQADSIVLDYGTTGNGFYEVNAIDGAYAANSPYAQVVTWTTHPATGQTLKMRLGNLAGVTDTTVNPTGYGLYSDNAYLKGVISAANNTVLINNDGVRVRASSLSTLEDINAYRFETTGGVVMGGLYSQNYGSNYNIFLETQGDNSNDAWTHVRSIGTASNGDANVVLRASNSTTPSKEAAIWLDVDGSSSLIRMIDAQYVRFEVPTQSFSDAEPYLDLGANLGSAGKRWGVLYANQIIAGAISGTSMAGATWQYAGSMIIDANSGSDTTVNVTNSGAGAVVFDVLGTIRQSGTAVSLSGHTHDDRYFTETESDARYVQSTALDSYVLKAGDTMTGNLSIQRSAATNASLYTAGDTAATAARFILYRARNTIGAETATQSGDMIGGLAWRGHDGSAYATNDNAVIRAYASETFTSSAQGTNLRFYTTLIGASSPSERVRIHNSGNVSVGNTTDGGYAFDVTGTGRFSGLLTASAGVTATGSVTASTSLIAPTITTASGNLSMAPAGGTTAITGTLSGTSWSIASNGVASMVAVTASSTIYTPVLGTASGNLSLSPAGGTVSVLAALAGNSTATFTTSVSAPSLITASGNLSINPAGGTTAITGAASLTGTLSSTSWNITSAGTATLPTITNAGALTISPTGNITLTPGGNVTLGTPSTLGSSNYASQSTGWRIDGSGGGDFRYLYTDELHAKSFIADLEQALAGGQIISKSVAVLASDFVVPYAGAQQALVVEDLPSAPNMAVFQANDIVLLRSFSRASGALTIGNCWGAVTSYTDGTGTQSWTFTRSGTTTYNTITIRGTATSSTSSAATSRSVTKPTGVVSGDVLIAVVTYDGSADVVTATDWTELGSATGTDITAHVLYKVAGGSEPASYTFSVVNSHAIGAAITAYSNVASSPIDGFAIQANAASANMTAPATWATSTAGMLVFAGGVSNNTAATPPASMTELIDTGSTGVRVYLADQLLSGSGSTGTKTATIASSSYASVAALVMLRPTYSSMTSAAGGIAPSTTIAAKSLVLDYGVSGNGFHEVNAIDGTYGANSPYSQVVTWTTHPATGQTVRTRTGNLYGLFAQANEYGFYAGSGVTTADNYIRLSSYTSAFNNVPISIYSSGTKIVGLDTTRGLDIEIDTADNDSNRAISFRSSGTTYSWIKSYNASGWQYIKMAAEPITGLNNAVVLRTKAAASQESSISINTTNAAGTVSGNYIYMLHHTDDSGAMEFYSTAFTMLGPLTLSNAVGGHQLIVSGTSSFNSNIELRNNDSAGASSFWIRNDGSNPVISTKVGDMYYGYAGRASLAHRWFNGGTTETMTLNTTGLGIGTAPSYKLDVNGAAHASSFPTSSDARFKENLTPLVNTLERIMRLGTYNFTWRKNYAGYDQFLQSDGSPVMQVGFVAQEVEQEFPELISRWQHTGKDGTVTSDAYSVDYARMVPILVQALRELRAEVAELRQGTK